MANVQSLAAGIGKLDQGVVLGLVGVIARVEYALLFPLILPFCFHAGMIVLQN